MPGSTRSRTHSRTASRIIRSSSDSSASRSRKSTSALYPAGRRTTGTLRPMDAPTRPGPRFGEEDRELSYGTYLRVPELLSLQSLLSEPPAHDELLFIVVHQA